MKRKSPRSHQVKGHARKKGKVGVHPYNRGRGGSKTSASSGSRAHVRSLLLKAKKANAAKAPKPARGEMEALTALVKVVEGEQIDRALKEVS